MEAHRMEASLSSNEFIPTPKAEPISMRYMEGASPLPAHNRAPDSEKAPLASQQDPEEYAHLSEAMSEKVSNQEDLPEDPELIHYRIEYVGEESGSFSIEGKADEVEASQEPPVLEYVEVRLSGQQVLGNQVEDISKTEKAKGHSYINILSPAVAEALRCVVDYFPGIDLSRNVIKIHEPYTVFVFFENELTAYRKRLAEAAKDDPLTCPNKWADKHLGIVQDFVRQRTQEAVEAERERHSRGYATFDMLWLLYKPGGDVYFDWQNVGEHSPYVTMKVDFELRNGATNRIDINLWNMDANSSWVGPTEAGTTIERFAGEKKIVSLRAYPCEFLRFSDEVDESDILAIKEHFISRGKKWYNLRRKVRATHFNGYTVGFPRRSFVSLAIVDPIQFPLWGNPERRELLEAVAHPANPAKICHCTKCEERIYQHAVRPKFSGYSQINPLLVENLTDHQYFLCDEMVEAFLFKVRDWCYLHIDGFQEASYDNDLWDQLVVKESTKNFIKNVTQTFIQENSKSSGTERNQFTKISQVHKREALKANQTWSADFIEGKGEGITILLHGKPGVGKTYTAECIANYTERPLLSLTCTDIGVKPDTIEDRLRRWFNLAEVWGAIMLIDEADIYMEQRQIQDIERNQIVAGFLRALEYYKGILFLTTNRVGAFDEAFMSRIHVQIHYPEFEDVDRDRLWNTFFTKLEDDRETTMRITQAAKDYVESQDLRALKWNGREIRNAFQVAVALAEAQGKKDKEGRIQILSDHIKATVQMSKEFQDYLVKLHRGNLSKKAALMGNRYDAYGKDTERSEKY